MLTLMTYSCFQNIQDIQQILMPSILDSDAQKIEK